MTEKMKLLFPVLRSRQEILDIIMSESGLKGTFESWDTEQQTEFLDFCTGVKGVKLLYDSFFKEIMDPDTAPERLNDFLSLLLHMRVEVLHVMPNDSSRIADESSLVIMDIVVRLADGSIVNVEVQKVGYRFPGQRCACYSADLLLRQYKQVRSIKKKKFNYKDIKNVYTIVLLEKSPEEFWQYPDIYTHKFEQRSDSGLELELLQKYIFVPLDIFREKQHNKPVNSELDAWLTFFSTDEPEVIMQLVDKFPAFKPMYDEVYALCRNIEGVMEMFSKELQQLDKNTVQYMMDEMQEEIDRKRAELAEMNRELASKDEELVTKEKELASKDEELVTKEKELASKGKELIAKNKELTAKDTELAAKDRQMYLKLIRQVCALLKKKKGPDEIAELLLEDADVVSKICEIASRFPAGYDENQIYEILKN